MASLSPSVVFTFQASQLFATAAAHVSLSRLLLLRLLANSKLTFNLTLPPSQPSILSALPHMADPDRFLAGEGLDGIRIRSGTQ